MPTIGISPWYCRGGVRRGRPARAEQANDALTRHPGVLKVMGVDGKW